MRIAIWGSYKFGNFGDDLMAVGLARRLSLCGHEVGVFGLSEHHMSVGESWRVEPDLDELVKWSDLIVLGGGALLVNYGSDHPVDRLHWTEVGALVEAIGRYEKPFIAVSVGGSGDPDEPLPKLIEQLFRSRHLIGATVRLMSDVARLSAIGVSAEHYEDIVFSLPRMFVPDGRMSEDRRPPYKIGVNLPRRGLTVVFFALLRMLKRLGLLEDVVSIDTYLKSSGAELAAIGKRVELTRRSGRAHLQFERCDEFLRRLSSLDLVVTYKLHVGVAMLALGGEFVSIGAKAKTKALLQSCSPSSVLLGKRGFLRFWRLLRGRAQLGMRSEVRTALVENSFGHFRYLERELANLERVQS